MLAFAAAFSDWLVLALVAASIATGDAVIVCAAAAGCFINAWLERDWERFCERVDADAEIDE